VGSGKGLVGRFIVFIPAIGAGGVLADSDGVGSAGSVVAGVAVPALAYLIYLDQQQPLVPALLGFLTVAALIYAWRFGLHPRLVATSEAIWVRNPFRSHRLEWDDITRIAPGENGILIGTEDTQVEAWCVQKSNYAAKRGRTTRADLVSHRLLDLWDEIDPPVSDAETGTRIRRARPDESRLLTRLEQAASQAELAHIFPPETFPYPVDRVNRRWHRLLHDRQVRVHLLERADAPVGYLAFDAHTVRHLGVVPDQTRRGGGSVLLTYATREMFDAGAREASLWVLTDNTTGRRFYSSHGWADTDDRRECAFEPYPQERRLTKANPAAPRRSRPAGAS